MIDSDVSKEETAWFEFESVPLKWFPLTDHLVFVFGSNQALTCFGESRHWPVGLLYDLFTGRDPSSQDVEEEHLLPWTLILHFRDYPHKHLMRLDNPAACHDAWMNLVKEVRLIIYGFSLGH